MFRLSLVLISMGFDVEWLGSFGEYKCAILKRSFPSCVLPRREVASFTEIATIESHKVHPFHQDY